MIRKILNYIRYKQFMHYLNEAEEARTRALRHIEGKNNAR